MSHENDAAGNPASTEEIDVSDGAAVARWCQALGVTDEALMKAVQTVGTRIDRIKDYMGPGRAGEQSDA
jgi:hypothetical protein